MKKIIIYLLALFFICNTAVAQTKTINGTVLDDTGAPLVGVNIAVGDGGVVAQTAAGGSFSIQVPTSGTPVLTFTFSGYTPQTVAATDDMSVALVKNIITGDEVVVIGYGTSKRKDLTGAISSISSKEISKVPVANAAEALSGRLAGVQVSSTEGSPDAEMKIRVRGGGSITGDNTPLLIVDGFPVNTISDIAPSDIESIDVLKDASSTAIYGSRGANGVIIVTTKSGKAGKFSVN
ncbi:MAG TPA: TonB-dependent receptor plug domain-containing protein, partial [Niabella sp.]|nr:TonB-dependent receptor plug domain-containing protein [Niabella sp.]